MRRGLCRPGDGASRVPPARWPDAPPAADRLTPIYPTTAGLQQATCARWPNRRWRSWHDGVAAASCCRQPCWMQSSCRRSSAALRYCCTSRRRTPSLAELDSGRHPARRRLAFEELLAHQLSLRLLRERTTRQAAPPLPRHGGLSRAVARERCRFTLTARPAAGTGRKSAPTSRSRTRCCGCCRAMSARGKTVVAALAALRAVEAGAQAALMAPTELLAEQHYAQFPGLAGPNSAVRSCAG
ncbi:MAG: hypothetical protein MZV65_36370 [Chromatiales bacterium]|nr:hypothetical protein [Chromatiales bacterium]